MALTQQQKMGALLEFGIGLPLNVGLGAWLYYGVLGVPAGVDSTEGRVIFAVQCCALPAMTMLLGVWAVALGRATTSAINPLVGAESRTLQVHIRYLSNTTEQVLLFVLSALSLSTFLGPETIRLIPTLALLFVLNRIVYWVGYLRDPAFRGLGLSGTIYPISVMVVVAAYESLQRIAGG